MLDLKRRTIKVTGFTIHLRFGIIYCKQQVMQSTSCFILAFLSHFFETQNSLKTQFATITTTHI